MVVSRWLVIPIPAISSAVAPILLIASTATPSMLAQISSASCSTQPGFGKYCVNSRCATLHISPFSLNRIHLLLVVPASSAITYLAIPFFSFVQCFCMFFHHAPLVIKELFRTVFTIPVFRCHHRVGYHPPDRSTALSVYQAGGKRPASATSPRHRGSSTKPRSHLRTEPPPPIPYRRSAHLR